MSLTRLNHLQIHPRERYDKRMEPLVIKLTQAQRDAIKEYAGQPLSILDPATQQAFVLIPRELYDSLTEYDDSPWTDDEMDLLAAEVDAMLDDDMAIEDYE